MPTIKKKLIVNTTAVTVGCGSACGRINLSKIFHLKPSKHKRSRHYSDVHHHHSSSSVSASTSWCATETPTTTTTTATLSPNDTTTQRDTKGLGWLTGNGMPVEKDSSDPYVDFRESMLQMIMEKEIYEKDDLRELLNCFLQLNSPYYHGIIVRAFTEIWNSLSN